jgi:hypothetical protein
MRRPLGHPPDKHRSGRMTAAYSRRSPRRPVRRPVRWQARRHRREGSETSSSGYRESHEDAAGPVHDGTWYECPGLVRGCARPSTVRDPDEGAIATGRTSGVPSSHATPRSNREVPGASVTGSETDIRPEEVRDERSRVRFTSRVTGLRPTGLVTVGAAALIEFISRPRENAKRCGPSGRRRRVRVARPLAGPGPPG